MVLPIGKYSIAQHCSFHAFSAAVSQFSRPMIEASTAEHGMLDWKYSIAVFMFWDGSKFSSIVLDQSVPPS
jgi:hypothetical protein